MRRLRIPVLLALVAFSAIPVSSSRGRAEPPVAPLHMRLRHGAPDDAADGHDRPGQRSEPRAPHPRPLPSVAGRRADGDAQRGKLQPGTARPSSRGRRTRTCTRDTVGAPATASRSATRARVARAIDPETHGYAIVVDVFDFDAGDISLYNHPCFGDTDGDGLGDDWETDGIDGDGDGSTTSPPSGHGCRPQPPRRVPPARLDAGLRLSNEATASRGRDVLDAPAAGGTAPKDLSSTSTTVRSRLMDVATGRPWGSFSHASHEIPPVSTFGSGGDERGHYDWSALTPRSRGTSVIARLSSTTRITLEDRHGRPHRALATASPGATSSCPWAPPAARPAPAPPR